ncbi:MAG: ABC transporter permease [Treponema sp.]|nr:ABC transporter permease [Treponema sp.]
MSGTLSSAIVIMTPLLFAATGGLFTELAGKLNIALEGLLLTGAFFAILAVHYTGSLAAGLFAAILASVALSTLLAFTSLKLRSNVFIAGLAANLLAGGLTVVLSQHFFNTRGVVVLRDFRPLPVVNIPIVENIPIAGELLSGHSVYVYAAWFLLFLAWLAIFKTPFGYRLRACGKHSQALVSLGLKPDTYRWAAFLVSGFFCGIGGSLLSLHLGVFVPGMTAGRGWIALVVIFLGVRKPFGLLAAAFIFGLAEALSNYAQGFDIPADLVLAMPYLLTLLAMIFVSVWTKRKNRVM